MTLNRLPSCFLILQVRCWCFPVDATRNLGANLALLCTDEDFMDISWRISFSGRSPGKLAFADMLSLHQRVNYTTSQYEKAVVHAQVELISQCAFLPCSS
jgi:hypothetical protein